MKRVILVGAGHAHAQVLRRWADHPLPGVELVMVSPVALAPYSGMVPGWLAGNYAFEEICIDVPALCAASGASFLRDELAALDAPRRRILLKSGVELDYDLLSLNVGSTLAPPPDSATAVLALRPIALLRERWEGLLQHWRMRPYNEGPFTVTTVGGGAAGIESLLAVLARLRAERPGSIVRGALVTRSAALLPGFAPAAVRAAGRTLERAGVSTRLGTAWHETVTADSDLVLWATGAEAQPWQRDVQQRGGLAATERGFIRVDTQLRSLSHPQVFAVGDCAECAEPLPKAGVYAVRMGPVLDRNLRAALGHGRAAAYAPQRRFLVLLATGDGRAIASRGGVGLEGRWAWRWKDRIDRDFIRRFALARASAPPTVKAATTITTTSTGDPS
ncbi:MULTISPECIES: FAD-dependent oxidoreductase [unclassified Variovorax]|uniref:FAD-dependent oxidoreductase n=1 Tax=unclassified Variovorax TaxID=663243 RepID=UPI003ED1136C